MNVLKAKRVRPRPLRQRDTVRRCSSGRAKEFPRKRASVAGVRRAKTVTNNLFGFLTTEPNAEVKAIPRRPCRLFIIKLDQVRAE